MTSDAGSTDPRARTDAFRFNPRMARMAVLLLAALLLLTLVAAFFGPGFDPRSNDPLWAALAVAFLSALLGVVLWMLRRRPVFLRIGPKGIEMPVGWRAPLAWSRVHRVRRLPEQRYLFERRQWVVVDPSPGVVPDYRLPGPRRLEEWHMRRLGVRIPLHVLDADPDVVIASIERFRPVIAES